jgi:hypothetical protein
MRAVNIEIDKYQGCPVDKNQAINWALSFLQWLYQYSFVQLASVMCRGLALSKKRIL